VPQITRPVTRAGYPGTTADVKTMANVKYDFRLAAQRPKATGPGQYETGPEPYPLYWKLPVIPEYEREVIVMNHSNKFRSIKMRHVVSWLMILLAIVVVVFNN
jgi:hypothetical protein